MHVLCTVYCTRHPLLLLLKQSNKSTTNLCNCGCVSCSVCGRPISQTELTRCSHRLKCQLPQYAILYNNGRRTLAMAEIGRHLPSSVTVSCLSVALGHTRRSMTRVGSRRGRWCCWHAGCQHRVRCTRLVTTRTDNVRRCRQ